MYSDIPNIEEQLKSKGRKLSAKVNRPMAANYILDDTAAGINAKAYDTNFSKNIRITFSGLPMLLKSAVVALIVNLSFVC